MNFVENRTSRMLDMIFCLAFMPMLILLGPTHYWMKEWPLFFTLVCIYLYGCYFAMKRVNLPKLILGRRYGRIGLMLAAMVACNYALSLYPLPKMDFVIPTLSEYQTNVRNYSISLTIWLMFLAVACYSLTIAFVKELYGQLLIKKDIENQRDKAELAIFKAQISPHFLFNTLNSLYSLVIGTSQKAEDAFIRFTDLLKYTYVTVENEYVPLHEEISCIQSYIDLQSIRLNNHTRVEWIHQADNPSVMIPPMIFLTFVENAFKYGASTSRDCTISISLTLECGTLVFRTRNSIMKHSDAFRKEVPVGIDNCRSRLRGIYPGAHRLETAEHDGTFDLTLTLKLQ